MSLRKHQQEVLDRAEAIVRGTVEAADTVIAVTPGGGKTKAAVEFAAKLMSGDKIDRVVFVVPTDALRTQVEESIVQARKGWHLRVADNGSLPFVRDGARGYITTYQSIVANPSVHQHATTRGRWLVVLDEFHHVADDENATWRAAIEPLVRQADHALYMTGTPERHDGKRLPFVERCYSLRDGKSYLAPDVQYSLGDALGERAVIRAEFHYLDGRVAWTQMSDDARVEGDLSTMDERARSKALGTFLDKCGEDAVERCHVAWLAHRASNPRAQMLVIARDQKHARAILKHLSVCGESAALAISDDTDSKARLKRFRVGKGSGVLVTVAMASEGFDAPGISHMCLLTNIRSTPWLSQAVARATRVDRSSRVPADHQVAHVYCPDDPWMRAFVEQWKEDQQNGLVDREERERTASADGDDRNLGYLPESGQLTTERIDNLNAVDSQRLMGLRSIGVSFPPDARPSEMMDKIREVMGVRPKNPPPVPQAANDADDMTPSERESTLRTACARLANVLARQCGTEPKDINRELLRRFRKNRGEMGSAELEQVVLYLRMRLEEHSAA